MKVIKFAVVLFVSITAQAQTNAPFAFAKLSDKPSLPLVSPEGRIIEARIKKLDQSAFEKRVAKLGLPQLQQKPEPAGSFQKILNGIDLDLPEGEGPEMINIETVSFGRGNAETFYDRVDVFESNLSPRVSVCYPTLIFESSSRGGNDGAFFLLNLKF
ncbi:MAG: hypothetical protein WC250_03945 [Candidatus Paceibacterota bacterium]|jgi:hypothetical protein